MTSELSDTVKTSNFCVLVQPFSGFFLSRSSIIQGRYEIFINDQQISQTAALT
jgi:hypothetical protein